MLNTERANLYRECTYEGKLKNFKKEKTQLKKTKFIFDTHECKLGIFFELDQVIRFYFC